MISLRVHEQVIAEQRKILMSNMTAKRTEKNVNKQLIRNVNKLYYEFFFVNKPPKAMQSHINQSESAGPNPVQPTIALAKNIGNIYRLTNSPGT